MRFFQNFWHGYFQMSKTVHFCGNTLGRLICFFNDNWIEIEWKLNKKRERTTKIGSGRMSLTQAYVVIVGTLNRSFVVSIQNFNFIFIQFQFHLNRNLGSIYLKFSLSFSLPLKFKRGNSLLEVKFLYR